MLIPFLDMGCCVHTGSLHHTTLSGTVPVGIYHTLLDVVIIVNVRNSTDSGVGQCTMDCQPAGVQVTRTTKPRLH